MAGGYNVRDAALKKVSALPNGAVTTTTTGIDTENGTFGDCVAEVEALLSVPALTTGELPDAQTITYTIEHDTDAAFGTAVKLFDTFVQTGAGGAGAAANSFRTKLPTSVKRHIRAKAVKTGASNASTKSMTIEVLS